MLVSTAARVMGTKMRSQVCREMEMGKGGKEGGGGETETETKKSRGRDRLREMGKRRYCRRERQRAGMKRNRDIPVDLPRKR